jgi:hypothetical protein
MVWPVDIFVYSLTCMWWSGFLFLVAGFVALPLVAAQLGILLWVSGRPLIAIRGSARIFDQGRRFRLPAGIRPPPVTCFITAKILRKTAGETACATKGFRQEKMWKHLGAADRSQVAHLAKNRGEAPW